MLRTLLQRVGKTVLLVTHDLDEALYLAQRVVFLDAGQIVADLPTADSSTPPTPTSAPTSPPSTRQQFLSETHLRCKYTFLGRHARQRIQKRRPIAPEAPTATREPAVPSMTQFLQTHAYEIARLTFEHLWLTLSAMLLAAAIGLPLGVPSPEKRTRQVPSSPSPTSSKPSPRSPSSACCCPSPGSARTPPASPSSPSPATRCSPSCATPTPASAALTPRSRTSPAPSA